MTALATVKPLIMILDDEPDIRMALSGLLEDEGYRVIQAGGDKQALEVAAQHKPDIALLDIWLEGSAKDGLGVLKDLLAQDPALTAIMMSGHGTIETAVRAIQLGAYDFIEKPFNIDRIYHLLERAGESMLLKRENAALKAKLEKGEVRELQGSSPQIMSLKNAIEKVAQSNSRVLISGPPGSGKEVVARAVHAASPRAHAPFVLVNCADLLPDRLEALLFGEQRADGHIAPGYFEQAQGGTLLLDEISDLPYDSQGKIVRMLQVPSFTRVGGQAKLNNDMRVLASSHANLDVLVANGSFREDLYYRLRVFPLKVPSLEERPEDIEPLVQSFLDDLAQEGSGKRFSVSKEALAALATYAWPGNVRQLRNAVEWMLIMHGGDASQPIGVDSLPPEVGDEKAGQGGGFSFSALISLPLREAREAFERAYLEAQVKRFMGNVTKTAQFVGMERSALHRKLKSLNIE